MDSFSKIKLSAENIEAISRCHFGSHGNLQNFEVLTEGFYNAAALLEMENGFKCVLKAAPPDEVRVLRYEQNIMKAEVEAMRLVRQMTHIPVPEIYCYDTSRSLLPSEFFVMEFLPGVPLHKIRKDLSPDDQARIEREMGRMAREMSGITGECFGYWAQPEPASRSWRDCFAHMLQGVLQDGLDKNVQLPLPYETLFKRLEAHFDALEEVTTPRLVHWDLWDGNVFVDPETKEITGLIDFERALWADPLIEVIFSKLMGPAQNYIEGFDGKILGTPNENRRRMLYNAYLELIMIIECYYRYYPTQDQENWARGLLDQELQKLEEISGVKP